MVDSTFHAAWGKGPEHYNQTRGLWQEYVNPDILGASIAYNGLIIPLRKNRFSVDRHGTANVICLWHSFVYEDQPGVRIFGRVYTLEYPIEHVQFNDNTFTYVHHNYEVDENNYDEDDDNRFVDATFTVTLSPAFARRIRQVITPPH